MFKGVLFMLGGHDNATWFNDVWRTSDGSSWQLVTANAEWIPRAAAALQPRGDVLYLFGGSDGLLPPIGKGKVFNDVWSAYHSHNPNFPIS